MIDPTLRLEQLARQRTTPRSACCCSTWCSATAPRPTRQRCSHRRSRPSQKPVVVTVVGTAADPQDRDRQVQALAAAGAEVHLSNALATRRAIELLGRSADACREHRGRAARGRRRGPGRRRHPGRLAPADARHRGRPGHGDGGPAAPRGERARAAPRCSTSPHTLVDVLPASEALGLEAGEFLHAGPPIEWERAAGPLRGALLGGAALEGLVDDPEDAVALFEAGRRSASSPATTAARSDRWPASSRRACGCGCWRTGPPGGVPTAR